MKIIKYIIDFIKSLFTRKKEIILLKEYPTYIPNEFDWRILEEINIKRLEKGLNVINYQTTPKIIDNIAYSHVLWLEKNINDTIDFKKRGHNFFQERCDQIQLRYPNIKDIGENLSKGFISPLGNVIAWDHSPLHADLMYGNHTNISIASNKNYVVTIYINIQ